MISEILLRGWGNAMIQRRTLVLERPGQVAWHEEEVESPGPNELVIRTRLCSIKHGTETMSYMGTDPFSHQEFDIARRIFVDRTPAESGQARPVGNMACAAVEHVGSMVSGFCEGDFVFGWMPVADVHVLPGDRLEPLGAMSPEDSVCVDPAIFSIGAIYDGEIRPGERVAVFGLGAIGLLLVQRLASMGVQVIAVEYFDNRLQLAQSLASIDVISSQSTADLGAEIKSHWPGGADVAVECSGKLPMLHQAIRSTRQCGRVVTVGLYGEGSGLRLGEEYFHNRISLLASLPARRWGNPTRGAHKHTYDQLRDEVVELFRSRVLRGGPLIDPLLPFDRAASVFDVIRSSPEKVVKVGIVP